MILPEGFALPPLAYFLPLILAAVVVGGAAFRVRPPITERTVLSFAPWMVAGAGLHALSVIEAVPRVLAPLVGTPSVYVSTFVLAIGCWAVGTGIGFPDRTLGATGGLAGALAVGAVIAVGLGRGTLTLLWPVVGFAATLAITGIVWRGFRRTLPAVAGTTGAVGMLVVFGHVLDGISTAIGIDVLAVTERSPLPRAIMGFAGTLPTAGAIGVGWLFVLVKTAVALGVVWLMAEYVEDAPAEGYLLLGAIAAVGFGPGTYNLLLFAVTG